MLIYWIRLGIILLPLALSATVEATPLTTAREQHLKAIYLRDLTRFFQWPQSIPAELPIHICLLGQSDNLAELTENARKKCATPQREIHLQTLIDLETLEQCHILFISASKNAQVADILNAAQAYPILTVSDMADFMRQGGMIEFFKRDEQIKRGINLDAVDKAGFQVSDKWLKRAFVMRPEQLKAAEARRRQIYQSIKRPEIKASEVPPGMRVMHTPFGDKLVPQ